MGSRPGKTPSKRPEPQRAKLPGAGVDAGDGEGDGVLPARRRLEVRSLRMPSRGLTEFLLCSRRALSTARMRRVGVLCGMKADETAPDVIPAAETGVDVATGWMRCASGLHPVECAMPLLRMRGGIYRLPPAAVRR
jgi:hypothetical protein